MKRAFSKLGRGGRRRSWSLARTALIFGALTPAVARAQGVEPSTATGLTLSWLAPSECPSEEDVRARVDALLGRSATGVAALDARALVTRTDGGYSLSLETVQGAHRGARAMNDASCVELARAAAAVIALAIDPTLTFAAPRDEVPAAEFPAPEPPLAAPPEASDVVFQPEARPSVSSRQTQTTSPEAWVGLTGAAALGTLPGFAPGFGLALSGRHEFLSLELLALRLPTQHVGVPDAPGVGADVDYLGVETRLCASKVLRELSPAVCAGFGAGRLRAVSRGASTPGSGSVTWVTPRLGGLVSRALGRRFAVHAGAQVLLPITRVEFTLENLEGAVYEPAPVGLLLDLGVAVRFW